MKQGPLAAGEDHGVRDIRETLRCKLFLVGLMRQLLMYILSSGNI